MPERHLQRRYAYVKRLDARTKGRHYPHG
jgi:hypothetical protein